MIRRVTFFVGLLAAAARADTAPLPSIVVTELPSPAALGSSGASISRGPGSRPWLSWLESVPGGAHALRFSTLDDAVAGKWSAPRTIAAGPGWFINWADFPALTVAPSGRATAVWFVNNPAAHGAAAGHDHGPGYRAMLSRTTDSGATWSAPMPLTRESDAVEFVSLATLADGRVLAAWLDGRGKKSSLPTEASAKEGGNAQQLFARVIGDTAPDTLIDASVCDCCQTTLTPFPDGGALLAYRGRTAEEVRDIRTVRFDGRTWQTPRPLNNDDWRIAGCPVNGPRLASDLGRVSAAWFTAADNDARVLASYSPDAGARFLQPLRIDRGHPAGHVDTLILRDSTLLVTWVENDGSLWLRRVNPDFSAGEPVALAPKGAVAIRSFPRSALVRDYTGGTGTAQFVTAYVSEGAAAALHTLLVTVPEGALLAAQSDCGCTPTPEQLAGVSMRGIAVSATTDGTGLRVRHGELPGVMAAGTHDFLAAPNVIASVTPGRDFFGRITQRDGAWWVFDVRLIGAPPEQR